MSEEFITGAKRTMEYELRRLFGKTDKLDFVKVASELIDDINWKTDYEFLHKGFAWLAWRYKIRCYDPAYE